MRNRFMTLATPLAAAVLLSACASDDAYYSEASNIGPQDPAAIQEAPRSTGMTDVSVSDYGTGLVDDPFAQASAKQTFFSGQSGDKVYFATDSSVLSTQARETLKGQANFLKSNPGLNIVVEGHCDERGTREYNLALGERRANAVKNYLSALGIAPSRISTVSFGKERPVALGSTPSAWSKNRRAVTIVE